MENHLEFILAKSKNNTGLPRRPRGSLRSSPPQKPGKPRREPGPGSPTPLVYLQTCSPFPPQVNPQLCPPGSPGSPGHPSRLWQGGRKAHKKPRAANWAESRSGQGRRPRTALLGLCNKRRGGESEGTSRGALEERMTPWGGLQPVAVHILQCQRSSSGPGVVHSCRVA